MHSHEQCAPAGASIWYTTNGHCQDKVTGIVYCTILHFAEMLGKVHIVYLQYSYVNRDSFIGVCDDYVVHRDPGVNS